MFEGMQISIIFYIIIVVVIMFLLFIMSGYLLWNYHLGKAMAPFFWMRIAGWTNSKVALFEIFSLINTVSLEEARREKGDGYRLHIPSTVNIPVKKKGRTSRILDFVTFGNFSKIFGLLFTKQTTYDVEKVKRDQNLIMPKSTYSINGVNTLPVWDLHPQLHTDVLEGVKTLIDNKIKTFKDLEKFISTPENANKNLFKGYSYRTFYELYLGVRQKYNIVITTDDVANFIGKQFDKNFRESIEAKDFNAQQAQKTDNRYLTYGYIAIILAIIIVGFKIIWQTIH